MRQPNIPIPMEISTDSVVVLDARVIGGWTSERVERFFNVVSYSHGADETMDFSPNQITVTFKGTSTAVARSKVTAAIRETSN